MQPFHCNFAFYSFQTPELINANIIVDVFSHLYDCNGQLHKGRLEEYLDEVLALPAAVSEGYVADATARHHIEWVGAVWFKYLVSLFCFVVPLWTRIAIPV